MGSLKSSEGLGKSAFKPDILMAYHFLFVDNFEFSLENSRSRIIICASVKGSEMKTSETVKS